MYIVFLQNDFDLTHSAICIRNEQTAPPDPEHPTIVSRLLNLEYVSRTCKLVRLFLLFAIFFLPRYLGFPPW